MSFVWDRLIHEKPVMRRNVWISLMLLGLCTMTVDAKQAATSSRSSGARTPRESRLARPVHVKLRNIVDPVNIQNIPAREALNWWSRSTGINLVVNWRRLDEQGIDLEAPLTVKLRNVRAGHLLKILLRQLSPDETLIYQAVAGVLEVLTREKANRLTKTRIYDVNDLLLVIPKFTNAPSFDLNAALSNTEAGGSGTGSRGGGGSGSSQGIFDEDDNEDEELPKSRGERGEDLAQLIRDSIESDIWAAHGGLYSSIKYFDGRLVIKAPQYVHEQIGIPTGSSRQATPVTRRSSRSSYRTHRPAQPTRPARYRTYRRRVSTVGRGRTQHVSGVGN